MMNVRAACADRWLQAPCPLPAGPSADSLTPCLTDFHAAMAPKAQAKPRARGQAAARRRRRAALQVSNARMLQRRKAVTQLNKKDKCKSCLLLTRPAIPQFLKKQSVVALGDQTPKRRLPKTGA